MNRFGEGENERGSETDEHYCSVLWAYRNWRKIRTCTITRGGRECAVLGIDMPLPSTVHAPFLVTYRNPLGDTTSEAMRRAALLCITLLPTKDQEP